MHSPVANFDSRFHIEGLYPSNINYIEGTNTIVTVYYLLIKTFSALRRTSHMQKKKIILTNNKTGITTNVVHSTSEKSSTSIGGGMNRFYAINQLPFGCNRLNFDNVHCLYVFPGGDT